MALSRPPGMGFAGIPASEIEAWQRIHRVALTAWEVDMIHELDKVAAKVAANDKKGGAHDDT